MDRYDGSDPGLGVLYGIGDQVDVIVKFVNSNYDDIYQICPININSTEFISYYIDFPPSPSEDIEGFDLVIIYTSSNKTVYVENIEIKESIDPSINIIYNENFFKNLLF